MLSSAAKFADDAAGLEKTLRLLQGFCTAVAGLTLSIQDAAPWRQARSQLAVGKLRPCQRVIHLVEENAHYHKKGRRYFRLLKWHSCWSVAHDRMRDDEQAFPKLLAVCNWSFLGLYYFIEMPTIVSQRSLAHFKQIC